MSKKKKKETRYRVLYGKHKWKDFSTLQKAKNYGRRLDPLKWGRVGIHRVENGKHTIIGWFRLSKVDPSRSVFERSPFKRRRQRKK